ncbi:hypothetical protein CSA37_08460 [Candidatus Fermentibacteria bacterium]|nr:MAG: hypothetical protein CSA37_08460 [Candidatus Fermentibacteria bacterium]
MRERIVFTAFLLSGIALRLIAMNQLDWFFGESLHVDEITWTAGDTPPFERPPANYLLASVSGSIPVLRTVYSIISLLPAAVFFMLRNKSMKNSVLAGVLAVEPTLLFSGLQVMPEAPAAAFLAGALCLAEKRKHLPAGILIGAAALFRGELLLFIPVSLFFIRPLRNWGAAAAGTAAAVLPVLTVNLVSGGPFAPGANGTLNLWLGSSWELLTTPPGIEYEELAGDDSFTDNAVNAILRSPIGWLGRGAVKAAAFFIVPGPGRNMETSSLLKGSILVFLIPVTVILMALAAAGLKKNAASSLIVTGIIAAFVFFPSVRHRAILIPAFAAAASTFRWKPAIPAALCILWLSLFMQYPGRVRPGLNHLLIAEHLLEKGEFTGSLSRLERAEAEGFEGADIHNLRGACIASSGGDLGLALQEFSMALRMAPESPSAWRNMAVILWDTGHIQDAVTAAEKAVSLNPELRAELTPVLSCPQ